MAQSVIVGRATAKGLENRHGFFDPKKSKTEMIAMINKTFETTKALITNFDISQLDKELDYFGLNRTKIGFCQSRN